MQQEQQQSVSLPGAAALAGEVRILLQQVGELHTHAQTPGVHLPHLLQEFLTMSHKLDMVSQTLLQRAAPAHRALVVEPSHPGRLNQLGTQPIHEVRQERHELLLLDGEPTSSRQGKAAKQKRRADDEDDGMDVEHEEDDEAGGGQEDGEQLIARWNAFDEAVHAVVAEQAPKFDLNAFVRVDLDDVERRDSTLRRKTADTFNQQFAGSRLRRR